MIDPVTATAMITGLVTSLTAYMKYRVDVKQAEQQGKPEPPKPEEQVVQQGTTALAVVEKGISQHGTPAEQTALTGFQQDPELYRPMLEQVLKAIVQRSPEFAQQLQTLGPIASSLTAFGNHNVQVGGGVSGSTIIAGHNNEPRER